MELNQQFDLHKKIKDKLNHFIETKKIPHIIFYGPNGSGKKTLLLDFINKIYNYDKSKINQYAMFVNCAHGKGISFIRDELKFFAKTNIHKNTDLIKSIILLNADMLTTDAQSALRRCIEKFSHTTRFFIVIENENGLLKPILSRFCNFYVCLPKIDNTISKSLYFHKKEKYTTLDFYQKKNNYLKKKLNDKNNFKTIKDCNDLVILLYNKGYSCLDIIKYIEQDKKNKEKEKFLMYFDIIRTEFRNDKLLMLIILNLYFMRKKIDLENILTI
tara:strand:+ start:6535 stop:7353 length:819 start_codon:yes stop_codon:yes gene_type:complete